MHDLMDTLQIGAAGVAIEREINAKLLSRIYDLEKALQPFADARRLINPSDAYRGSVVEALHSVGIYVMDIINADEMLAKKRPGNEPISETETQTPASSSDVIGTQAEDVR